jgi:hypothetical protein
MSDHPEGKAKRQLCLAMIAGGDSPERAAERLALDIRIVDVIIALDMTRRSLDATKRSGK